MNILGVRIDNFSKKEILAKIESFLNEDKFHQVATINPEFILRAQKDKEFNDILNGCDLNVADGIGIWYAFLNHFRYLKARIAGADLMYDILRIANKEDLGVFLAIHPSGLSSFEEIKSALVAKYPNIKIGGENIDPKKNKKWPAIVGYQVVFCNFGFPRQEKFINSIKNDSIRLAMGVGGSFDFETKRVKRAPRIMQFLGLEWFWRLLLEPRYRFKRMIRATIIFPFKVLFSKKKIDNENKK